MEIVEGKNRIFVYDEHAEIEVIRQNGDAYRVLIDVEDVDKCSKLRWGVQRIKGKEKKIYIAHRMNDGKKLYIHRFVLDYDGELEIDHINREPLDNRKENLRIVERIINTGNRNGGITKRGNKYQVAFVRFGKRRYSGRYDTYEEAETARDKLLKEIEKNEKKNLREFKKENHSAHGITKTNSGYTVTLCNDGKQYYIGTFKDFDNAVVAKIQAETEFDRLNPSAYIQESILSFWDKYIVTIDEAADNYGIPKSDIENVIANNPDLPWIVKNEEHYGVKRNSFDRLFDKNHNVA